MADPRQPPEPDPFRMAIESNTPGWQGPRNPPTAQPPIWVDRPRGSVAAAVVLALLSSASALLFLYDVGALSPPARHEVDGVITLVRPGSSRDSVLAAVSYDGDEEVVEVSLREHVRPREGEPVVAVTHVRYFRRHLYAVRRADDEGSQLYLEPPHGVSVHGLVGLVAAVSLGGLAWTQLRLARSHHRREVEWQRAHPEVEA